MDADTFERVEYQPQPETLERPSLLTDEQVFARVVARLEKSRDYWITRAYVAENELMKLRQVRNAEGR